MRNRINCPDIDLTQVRGLDPKILQIVSALKSKGLEVAMKNVSLDWDVPIVHAILSDSEGRIPAFAHGMGAGFDWATAAARAVTEVVQVHSGLHSFTQEYEYWKDVTGGTETMGNPPLAWSDPLFYPQIEHLIAPSVPNSPLESKVGNVSELIEMLRGKGHEIMVAKLGEMEGLTVVRVLISGATQPDACLERVSDRMRAFAKGGRGFYVDPILT